MTGTDTRDTIDAILSNQVTNSRFPSGITNS